MVEDDTAKTIKINAEVGGAASPQVSPETATFDNVTLTHSTAEVALPVTTASTPVGTIITARTASTITLKAGSYNLDFQFDAAPTMRRFAPQIAIKSGATELRASTPIYFRLSSNIRRAAESIALYLASDTEVNFVARTVEYAPTSDESGAGGSGALNNIRCLIQPVGGIKGDRGPVGPGNYDDSALQDRISEQEYKTEDLEHRTHTNWAQASSTAAAAVWVTPSSSDVGSDQLPGQTWVVNQTGLSSGAHNVYLRIPTGNLISKYRVSAGSAGVFHDGWAHRLTQGGFTYLEQINPVVLAGATSFQAQVSGETQNTRFKGWFDGRMSQAAFESGVAGSKSNNSIVKVVNGVPTWRPDAGGLSQAQVDGRIAALRPRPLSASDRVKLDLITRHEYIRGVYMSPAEAPRTLTTSTPLTFHVHVTPNAFPEAASSGRVWVSVGGIEKYVAYRASADRYTIAWTPTASEIIELDNNQSWQTASDIRFSVWITAGTADSPSLALYQDNFVIRDAVAAGPTYSAVTTVNYNLAARNLLRKERWIATGYSPDLNADILELWMKLGNRPTENLLTLTPIASVSLTAFQASTIKSAGDNAQSGSDDEIIFITAKQQINEEGRGAIGIARTSANELLIAASHDFSFPYTCYFQTIRR